MSRIDELSMDIHEVEEHLTELDRAISGCGIHRLATPWFTDRVRASEQLLAIRRRLYRELAELLQA